MSRIIRALITPVMHGTIKTMQSIPLTIAKSIEYVILKRSEVHCQKWNIDIIIGVFQAFNHSVFTICGYMRYVPKF